jgi:transcriptional regulator with XRE-family HTH domain
LGEIIKSNFLRDFLSANIKARRRALDISQERLAELADVSIQMVKRIEGRQSWVSDKMLIKLADALKVSPFQLLVPVDGAQMPEDSALIAGILTNLRQNVRDDIDARFSRILEGKKPPSPR